jgi:hypothetical protein
VAHRRTVVVDVLVHVLAVQFFQLPVQNAFGLLVHVGQQAVRVHGDDAIVHIVQQGGQPQCLFLLCGQIAQYHLHTMRGQGKKQACIDRPGPCGRA